MIFDCKNFFANFRKNFATARSYFHCSTWKFYFLIKNLIEKICQHKAEMKKVGAADSKQDVINFPRKTFQSTRQVPEIFRETTHYEAWILPPTHSACCVTRNLDLTFLMRNARKWIFTTEKRLRSCCNWLLLHHFVAPKDLVPQIYASSKLACSWAFVSGVVFSPRPQRFIACNQFHLRTLDLEASGQNLVPDRSLPRTISRLLKPSLMAMSFSFAISFPAFQIAEARSEVLRHILLHLANFFRTIDKRSSLICVSYQITAVTCTLKANCNI